MNETEICTVHQTVLNQLIQGTHALFAIHLWNCKLQKKNEKQNISLNQFGVYVQVIFKNMNY